MRTPKRLLIALACLLILGGTEVGAQSDKKPTPPTPPEPKLPGGQGKAAELTRMRWEYRVLGHHELTKKHEIALETGLNQLGADGWELVAAVPTTVPGSSTYIFRRPLGPQRVLPGKPAADPAPKEKAEARLELHIYALKNAVAVDVAHLVADVLRDSKHSMRITADPRTNQVIVHGAAEAHFLIEALLARLDVPTALQPQVEKKKD